MELISREDVNRLLHNQREMQSRVNQLPTYDACYLGSPCEYQNEDIKMPPQESTIDEKTKTSVLFSFYDLAEIEEYISGYIRLTEITSGRKVPSYVIEMYKYVDSKRKELLRKIKADKEGAEE